MNPAEFFTFSFVAHEATDVQRQWVAHCLDLNLVSQGDSFRDAVEGICEAVQIALGDGAPDGYRRAPGEAWARHSLIIQTGKRVPLAELYALETLETNNSPTPTSGAIGLHGSWVVGQLSVLQAAKAPKIAPINAWIQEAHA